MSYVTPLHTLLNTPETLHTWHITNFNYEGSYLPGVICNIVLKADLGRWTPQGIKQRCPEYHYTKIGRQTYFAQWTPQWIKGRCLKYATPKLVDGPTLAGGPPSESRIDALNTTTPNFAGEPTLANRCPQWIENRCLEYHYTKLGRQNYFGQWTDFTLLLTSSGQEWQLHTATDMYWSRMAISYCYWHLVVKNGN